MFKSIFFSALLLTTPALAFEVCDNGQPKYESFRQEMIVNGAEIDKTFEGPEVSTLLGVIRDITSDQSIDDSADQILVVFKPPYVFLLDFRNGCGLQVLRLPFQVYFQAMQTLTAEAQ